MRVLYRQFAHLLNRLRAGLGASRRISRDMCRRCDVSSHRASNTRSDRDYQCCRSRSNIPLRLAQQMILFVG
jgi:hypothetical protein